ncbi:ABC transporter permease [Roseomonas indoligenes]|uniref:ABC transporter permease n=1 Tax=Roseomonas indoligenes TaxID=2820811 RepID=A0A940MW72_9PROT|nr:ABC transporter permease [Pararoseomonas indoligenes]MBP0494539.1 ABC transporter permease [Pararoseomonas indoligenes]
MRVRLNALIGGALTVLVLGTAVLSAFWTPQNPLRIAMRARLNAPSAAHWLGTDEVGRDVVSRLMAGAGTSCLVAALTVVFAVVVGSLVGLLAGFARGWVDRLLMLVNDALLAFPGILLALGLLAVIGPGPWGIVLALGLAYTPTVARIVRGAVLSIREREFVEASRSIGNSEAYTMMRHVLPGTVSPLIVLATSLFGWAILAESALSFLGLGVPPPAPTWGNMLSAARPYLESASWLGVAPGACIALTLLGVNLLGDALRDRLDPRSQAR